MKGTYALFVLAMLVVTVVIGQSFVSQSKQKNASKALLRSLPSFVSSTTVVETVSVSSTTSTITKTELLETTTSATVKKQSSPVKISPSTPEPTPTPMPPPIHDPEPPATGNPITLTHTGGGHITWVGHDTSKIIKIIFAKTINASYTASPIHYERSGSQNDAWFKRDDLVRIQPSGGWERGTIYVRVCEYINYSVNDCVASRYSNTIAFE